MVTQISARRVLLRNYPGIDLGAPDEGFESGLAGTTCSMEGTPVDAADTGPGSRRGFSIEWTQDRQSRRVRITGVVDSSRVRHVGMAMVDLGRRRLTIDLSGAVVRADCGLEPCLEDLRLRLGMRLAGIIPPAHGPSSNRKTGA